MKLEFSQQIFEKYTNINFHEHMFSANKIVLCGQTDGQTDMTKPTVAFRISTNIPNERQHSELSDSCI